MKKVSILGVFITLWFSSCKTAQLTSNADDVYTTPSEIRLLAKLAAEQKAKVVAREKFVEDSLIALQKAKDDANPYYKEPSYSADDYYDYQYASRITRFNRPLNGASYYDPFYTNCYTYNQNSLMYGTSIYSTYNYWQPNNQMVYYSNGSCMQSGYYGANPYSYSSNFGSCYNNNVNYSYWSGNGWNNGFCSSNGYNNYYYGGNNGWNNYGCNNGGWNNNGCNNNGWNNNGWNNNGNWGYFNSHDPNSGYSKMSYGQRGENNTGNNGRELSPNGRLSADDNSRARFVESVAAEQNNAPRFASTAGQRISNGSGTSRGSSASEGRMTRDNNASNTADNNYYNTNRTSSSSGSTRTESGSTRSESASSSSSSGSGGGFFGTRITQQQSNDWSSQQNNNSARSSGGGGDSGSSGSSSSSNNSAPSPRSSGDGGTRPR
jgi:hypothetical protein